MINGKHTKIFDFGYGDKTNAKYCIRTDERTLSSSLSDKSEGLNQEEMKEKDKILVNWIWNWFGYLFIFDYLRLTFMCNVVVNE